MIEIKIIPINTIDIVVLNHLKDNIPYIIPGTSCSIGEVLGYPPWAINIKRNQILSIELLYHLEIKKDVQHYNFILGVIDYDIYAPGLNFIFGQAMENIALISITRLRPEFYGENPDQELFLKRVLTEAIHELGHAFGLTHCANPYCVMHFSNSIEDTDRKSYNFCKRCYGNLQIIIKNIDL